MLTPVAKAGILFNINRLFNNFNLLNHSASVFNLIEFTAAIRADVKCTGLRVINFICCKRRSFVFSVSGLAADITRTFVFLLSRRFDNVRRLRLGRVRRILREFSDFVGKYYHLLGQFGIDFYKLSNLLFTIGN